MKKLLPLAIVLLPFLITAQTKLVTGKVIDKTTQEPLSYATIQIPNTSNGTITNEDGYFELKMKADQKVIEVSYIGYQNAEVTIKKTKKPITIALSTFDFNLQEVIVRAKSPLQYIQEAIAKYPENINKSPFSTRGFFLEKSKLVNDDSGAYTKNEAVFQSYFDNYGDTTAINQNQLALFRTSDKGEFRSMLYENKKIKRKMKKGKINMGDKDGEDKNEEGSEDGEESLDIDIQSFTGGGPEDVLETAQELLQLDFLTEEYFKKINYTFGENTVYKNRNLIVIDFNSRRKIDHTKYVGSIYLDYENLAFVAIKYKAKIKIPFLINALIKTVVGFTIDNINQDISIQNQYFDGFWYPKELVKLSEITLKQKGQLELISSEQLFNIDKILTAGQQPIMAEHRFDAKFEYEDQIFKIEGLDWENVNVVK